MSSGAPSAITTDARENIPRDELQGLHGPPLHPCVVLFPRVQVETLITRYLYGLRPVSIFGFVFEYSISSFHVTRLDYNRQKYLRLIIANTKNRDSRSNDPQIAWYETNLSINDQILPQTATPVRPPSMKRFRLQVSSQTMVKTDSHTIV